jgi:predicted DNA-binding transcriptional regulator AlpA
MEKSKKYLRARQVRARYDDISDMTLWRWIQHKGFPEPEYINGHRYWDERKLDEHDRQRQAEAS